MSKSRALVLITTSFPISRDGSEAAGSFVSDLAEELARHVPVRVVAPGPQSKREPWSKGIEVFRFAATYKPLSTLKPWILSDLFAIRRVLKAGADATRQAVLAGPAAHILALWALPSGHWARNASRESDVPYSVWTLGSDIWTLGRIPLVRSYLRRVLHEAHTCYSDGLKLAEDTRNIALRDVEFLLSTRRIERKRVAPLKTAPPYRLLFLGRWHPNKGADVLLQALKLLSDNDWNRIEVVEIFGGGPMDAEVRSGVARLRARGRPVELGGYLAKSAAENAILRADYLLIPSRIESIPVIFSDAMKLGCPVVCSPVGDLPELVASVPASGWVAQAVSANAFAEVLKKALSRDPRVFAKGIAERAQRFDIADVARRLLQMSPE